MAAAIGDAPRQRGSSEAWTLMPPYGATLQQRRWQHAAVCGDHDSVRPCGPDPRHRLWVAERGRQHELDACRFGQLGHWRAAQTQASTGRSIRPADDQGHFVAIEQGPQRGHRELRGTHEDDAHRADPSPGDVG